jgi:hypothetical protein
MGFSVLTSVTPTLDLEYTLETYRNRIPSLKVLLCVIVISIVSTEVWCVIDSTSNKVVSAYALT